MEETLLMNQTTSDDHQNDSLSLLLIDNDCHYEVLQPHMLVMRFWMVSIVGSTISFISIVENIFLFIFFVSSRRHRRENLFMMLLAFFDIFVSMAYILLMSVNVLSDVLMSPTLVSVWYTYMIPIITISHIAMTSSSFLIVAASFERYCVTLNTSSLRFVQRNRFFIALSAIFLGVISKGSISVEFELVHHQECDGQMTATTMRFRSFVFETNYHLIFRFWYRNFVTVFAPFFILLYLNFRIVKALTTYSSATVCLVTVGSGSGADLQKRKAVARAATRTLVMVGFCYLISNIINVILTSLEQTNSDLGMNHPDLYIVSIDMVSLLTTMACAARLPIYLYCQPALRKEIVSCIGKMCQSWVKTLSASSPSPSLSSSSSSPPTSGDKLKSIEAETSGSGVVDARISTISENDSKSPSPYETLL